MRRVATTMAFAIATIASTAHADSIEAETLFRDGRRAAVEGNFDLACAKFEASEKLDPAPGTLLNLADCEEARGQLASALHAFIAVAGELADSDPRKTVALERARRLERTMPKLRVRVVGAAESVRVFRDNAEIAGAIGLALPVDPGAHVVTVREAGHRDHAYDVTIGREGERDIEVQHGPRIGEHQVGLVLGGVGLATAGVGVTMGAVALTQHQTQSLTIATGVVISAGAALLITSAVLLLWPHAPIRTSLGSVAF